MNAKRKKKAKPKLVREALVLKLRRPNAAKAAWLAVHAERYRSAVAWALDKALQWDLPGRRDVLHYDFYHVFRERFGLQGETARTAVIALAGLLAGYDAKLAEGSHARPPCVRTPTLGLGGRAYTIMEREGRYVLRVSTEKRRTYLWLPLCAPPKYHTRIAAVRGDAKLFQRGDDWYISLPVRVTTPTGRSGEPVFIGVDRGIVQHAVAATADGRTCKFFRGKEARHRRNCFAGLRRRYARHGRIDKLRAARGRESAWMRDVNHKISRALVDFALARGGRDAVIVLEDLKFIRECMRGSRRGRREVNAWAFGQLGARPDGAKEAGCRIQCHSGSNSNLESSVSGTSVL